MPGEFTPQPIVWSERMGERARAAALNRFPFPTDIGISHALRLASLRGRWWWWRRITVHISVSITLPNDNRRAASFAAALAAQWRLLLMLFPEFRYIGCCLYSIEATTAQTAHGVLQQNGVIFAVPPPPSEECPLAKKLSFFPLDKRAMNAAPLAFGPSRTTNRRIANRSENYLL